MELIRKEYPLDDQHVAQIFNAHITPDGIKMEPQETKLWQFSSIDRKWGIIINEQALFLHTSNYHDFVSFAKRFRTGISALVKVDKIEIGWMTSIGIRYVNMITTVDGASLKDYLKPWVLPIETPHSTLEIIQGINAVRYKTECGGVRLQALYNPTFTLPPELNSPFILKNGWTKERPSMDFALVDIDHCTMWQNPLKFNEDIALETLGDLRKSSRVIFDSIGTTHAMKIWEG
jgi:uncharacterized protein (TIGR04255 family)